MKDYQRVEAKNIVIDLIVKGKEQAIASTLTRMVNGLLHTGKHNALKLLAEEDEVVMMGPNLGPASSYLAKLLVQHNITEIKNIASSLRSIAERKENNRNIAIYLVKVYKSDKKLIKF